MARLSAPHYHNGRKPRKDKDVAKRAVVSFLSWAGNDQRTIADILGVSQGRVGALQVESTYSPPPQRNWRLQNKHLVTFEESPTH